MKIQLTILLLILSHWGFSQRSELEILRDSLYALNQKTKVRDAFQEYTDSLNRVINITVNDSIRGWAMVELSNNYKYKKPDSAVFFARKAIELGRENKWISMELDGKGYYILTESSIGNDAKALQLTLELIKQAEEFDLPQYSATGSLLLGWTYYKTKKYRKAIENYNVGLDYFKIVKNQTFSSLASAYLGESYSLLNQKDSALFYCRMAESYSERAIWTEPFITLYIGRVYRNLGNEKESLRYLHRSRITAGPVEAFCEYEATQEIAKLYRDYNEFDSALFYGNKALSLATKTGFFTSIIDANQFLSEFFKQTDAGKALVYNEIASIYKDSLSQMERSMAIEDYVSTDEAQRQSELEAARKDFQSRLKMNALMGSSFTLLVVAFVLFRSRRAKQKAKQKIEEAYDQLKSTQSQLIHSEKMASLGELTAGIAHEIQNPLNFVNNFSDVSKELIGELKSERSKKDEEREEKLEEKLLEDIDQNLDKIHHHGMRASDIVKSMLQHSRTGTGEKELTDINALCDEYLRLAYHGLRAKDKSFNADFSTQLDPNLPEINVVPQDIGRVLLNLINNAFQAVGGAENPEVVVSTKKLDGQIEIRVRDNGHGIPEQVRDKIFQPFFTTKPTGQGTGLGLSMSYDIITKGHGGIIEMETKEGKGTEFIITLPVN